MPIRFHREIINKDGSKSIETVTLSRKEKREFLKSIGIVEYKPNTPTNSVSKLRAQNNILCKHDLDYSKEITTTLFKISKDISLSIQDKAVISILLLSGCRISEVLELSKQSIIDETTIKVVGKKNSKNRIISLPSEIVKCIQRLPEGWTFENYTDRYRIYRHLKKHGFSGKVDGNKKNSVTHLARHLKIKSMEAKNIAIEDIQQFIGHKSIKNTEKYIKPLTK